MGCFFCIPKKSEEPTESLYLPLLQQDSYHNQNVLYRIDSKSSEDSMDKSLRDSKSPSTIRGSLSFHEDVDISNNVFQSCVEDIPPTKMSLLQKRLEQLEMNTQENIRLLSEDVHLIYQTMVDKNDNKKEEKKEKEEKDERDE